MNHDFADVHVRTAFWLVPRKVVMRRFCFSHLKNSSICQRAR